MRRWLGEVWAFVWAVLRRGLLVSGSAVVAVLGYGNEHKHWVDLSGAVFVWLAVALVFVACFLVWRDERRKQQALTFAIDADLTELARLRTQGVNLQAAHFAENEFGDWRDAHMEWAGAVADVLRRRFPEDQWSRFTALGELRRLEVEGPVQHTAYYLHRAMLRKQFEILESLMDDLRSQVNDTQRVSVTP